MNPSNTVYDAKRLIGRKYGDNTVQHDKKLLPYELLTPTGLPPPARLACPPTCPPVRVPACLFKCLSTLACLSACLPTPAFST